MVPAEVEHEYDSYFQNYGTIMAEANYKVQSKPSKPSIVIGQDHGETNTLSVYALISHAGVS
eukprot:14000155-Ditylum_brightwellii.AAC.1